ncbi:MAG: LysM peptidoglycan-binding domain-containing protein [Chloroflexota bacterium]
MQGIRQFGNALALALLSVGLVLGGLSLAMVEFASPAPLTPTDALIPSPVPLTATATLPPPLESPTSTVTPSSTATPPPPPSSCPVPSTWIGLYVQPGDTLESLATRSRTTSEALRQGNCLSTSSLVVNSIVYVPNVPTNTVAACVPGAVGWVKNYSVRPGDTLFHIATQYYTDTATLKRVNCLVSDRITVNQLLWVPNRATRTPTPTTVISTPITPIPTEPWTVTVPPPTSTTQPTDTVPPPTVTPSATTQPTITPSVTAFPTATP